MLDLFAQLRELLPFLGPVPAATTWPMAVVTGLQYDWFELTAIVAAVLFNIRAAKLLDAFLQHAREHDNQLNPLEWVRYVILSLTMIQNGKFDPEKVPNPKLWSYLGLAAYLAAVASLAYYDISIASITARAGADWANVVAAIFFHWIAAFCLITAAAAALMPLIVPPVLYLNTLKRAIAAL
jgi:hypothetical protein